MLPAILVTFATFILELCSASPVYNMQPAFITAHIGTTGRNIRNLPCVSRKNHQRGVCMFAIDCLKANGTHLGTCIDRFYFGSCCHIAPVNDIIENTIDVNDIIPSREPPLRISNTTVNPITRPVTSVSTSTSSSIQTSSSFITSASTHEELSKNITAATIINIITKRPSNEEASSSTERTRTTEITKPSTEKVKPTTERTRPSSNPPTEETTYQKLTTFQSIAGSSVPETTTNNLVTTSKVTEASVIEKATHKPNTSRPKPTRTTTRLTPRPSIRPTLRPKPTKVPTKPSRPTRPFATRPAQATTQKVTQKPAQRPTQKPPRPITVKPTRPVITIKPSLVSKEPSITRKPTKRATVATKPTKKVSSTTQATFPTRRATQRPTLSSSVTESSFYIATTTPSNEILVNRVNVTTGDQPLVSGNPATNEIEPVKPIATTTVTSTTTKATLVTWAVVEGDKDISKTTVKPPSHNTTTDWQPITTTPDGWVLLTFKPAASPDEKINATSSSASTISSSTISSLRPGPELTTTPQGLTESPATTSTPTSISAINATTLSSQEVTNETLTTASLPEETTTDAALNQTTQTTVSSTTALIDTLSDKPVNMSDFTDVCGRRMFPEARIVGGEKSTYGKWPWQISLRQWRTSTYLHKCGAALLNENWAITAAHCVDNVPPSDLLLRLGEHDLSTEAEAYPHQERRIQIVASHPQFDPRTFEYDLALLRFYEPVTFQPNIIPVCVPQTDENFVGRTAYVTGWGRLYEDGPLPSVLQEVSVPIVNNSVCESMYKAAGYIEHIPNIFICAGWRRGGFDSCEGDSGGPLVIQREDRRFLLAGVISWGIGCAEPNQPGVYTRISQFRDWINQILQF